MHAIEVGDRGVEPVAPVRARVVAAIAVQKLDAVAAVITKYWPEAIDPTELRSPTLWADIRRARAALLSILSLDALLSN